MFQSLTSWLVIGSLLLGVALVLFMFLYRTSRRSPHAWVVNEIVLSSLFAPLVVVLLAFGVGGVLAAWAGRSASPIGFDQVIEAVLVLGVAVVLAGLLRRGAGSTFQVPAPRVPEPPVGLDRAA